MLIIFSFYAFLISEKQLWNGDWESDQSGMETGNQTRVEWRLGIRPDRSKEQPNRNLFRTNQGHTLRVRLVNNECNYRYKIQIGSN